MLDRSFINGKQRPARCGNFHPRCCAGGVNWPVSGGGYFRLYPAWLTCKCLARLNQRHGQPLMFYVHPWEIDPAQPRLLPAR